MDNRNRNDFAGWIILFWISIGFLFVPILCVVTVMRDGWDNTPDWMKIVSVFVSIGFVVVSVLALANNIH
jgi:hypothetical protein